MSVGFAGFMSGTGVLKLREKRKMNTGCRGEHMALKKVPQPKIWGQTVTCFQTQSVLKYLFVKVL